MQNKNVQLVLQHCCQTSRKVMLHVSSLHVQTRLATNQVVASCLNTDFWLDKITRESCRTRELPQGLAAKQVCLGSVKCTTCKDFVQQLFATCINLICCKTGWFLGGKMCTLLFNSFCSKLQNKLDVFVAHWVILENIHTIPWTA